MTRRTLVLSLTCLLFVTIAGFAAPPEDRGLGQWAFNAKASTYESAPAPRESTRIWEAAGTDKSGTPLVHFLHTTVGATGQPGRTEFTAGYDGRRYPVSGSSRYDTVELKLVNANVVEQTFRLKGEVTVNATRTISADGNQMTIIATGTNPDGKKFRNVLVYSRVKAAR
ncbi:MAG: hypothetical protein NTZ56_21975 [Acidobacteria bacterium]|nr:hypothetical protein [Acidobacteriota bacterium]